MINRLITYVLSLTELLVNLLNHPLTQPKLRIELKTFEKMDIPVILRVNNETGEEDYLKVNLSFLISAEYCAY